MLLEFQDIWKISCERFNFSYFHWLKKGKECSTQTLFLLQPLTMILLLMSPKKFKIKDERLIKKHLNLIKMFFVFYYFLIHNFFLNLNPKFYYLINWKSLFYLKKYKMITFFDKRNMNNFFYTINSYFFKEYLRHFLKVNRTLKRIVLRYYLRINDIIKLIS